MRASRLVFVLVVFCVAAVAAPAFAQDWDLYTFKEDGFKVDFPTQKVGVMDTELFREWFQAFAQNAGITLHIENLYGENNHHIAETCYKGLARALRRAVEADARQAGRVPSTKGTLAG